MAEARLFRRRLEIRGPHRRRLRYLVALGVVALLGLAGQVVSGKFHEIAATLERLELESRRVRRALRERITELRFPRTGPDG